MRMQKKPPVKEVTEKIKSTEFQVTITIRRKTLTTEL